MILGRTGRNVAAGMTGGVAYVLDADGRFDRRCNLGTVDLEPIAEAEDDEVLRTLVERHARLTGSALAARLLADWTATRALFVKLMPRDYKRILMSERLAAAAADSDAALGVARAAHG